MRISILLIIFVIIFLNDSASQTFRQDTRPQLQKEDTYKSYKADDITNLDLIRALEVAGVNIFTYELGEFDKKYNFDLILEEYRNGEMISFDTLVRLDTDYHYFLDNEDNYYIDFIENIKIISKTEDSTLVLHIYLYGTEIRYNLHYKKFSEDSFYSLRYYAEAKWKMDKKIPLLVFASSWYDEHDDIQRFCGASKLNENEDATNELLNSSPHYYVLSYRVSEIE